MGSKYMRKELIEMTPIRFTKDEEEYIKRKVNDKMNELRSRIRTDIIDTEIRSRFNDAKKKDPITKIYG